MPGGGRRTLLDGDADISIGTKTDVHLHRVTGKLSKTLREAARLRIDDQ